MKTTYSSHLPRGRREVLLNSHLVALHSFSTAHNPQHVVRAPVYIHTRFRVAALHHFRFRLSDLF